MATELEHLLGTARNSAVSQKTLARSLGISAQYLCDLTLERRAMTPELVNKLCKHFGYENRFRKRCHVIAARKQGWDV